MREYLTVEREANAIRLRRSTFSGTFLLVEGVLDQRFYQRFVNKQLCVLVVLAGKPSSKLRVIEVLSILESSDFHGVLGIVDADFDHVQTPSRKNENLLLTDTHDLETLLLSSPALDKLLSEFASEPKLANFSQEVRTVILNAGLPLGYLRWIAQLDDLNLTFEGIDFSKFVNKETLLNDENQMLKVIKNKSQMPGLDENLLQHKIRERKQGQHDPWQICCGHDLIEILALALQKAIGTQKKSDVEPAKLEQSLRLAYENAYFCETRLFLLIQSWELSNQPFTVLQQSSCF